MRLRLRKNTWIPIGLFVLVSFVVVFFWLAAGNQRLDTLKVKTQLTSEQVAIRLEEYINIRLNIVSTMRWYWQKELINDRESFTRHASYLQQNFGGLAAINWIDPDGVIRWVVPEIPNEGAKGKSLHEHPQAASTFKETVKTGNPGVTPPIDLLQGGEGIAAYYPLLRGEKVEGYLNAVFRLTPLVEECLAKGVRKNFHLLILDHARQVYCTTDQQAIYEAPIHATSNLGVGTRTWSLTLSPAPNLMRQVATQEDYVLLGLGLLLALGLALLSRRLLQREFQLGESEERYRTIFQNAQVGMFRVRIGDGKVLESNQVMAEIFGFDNVEDFTGSYYIEPNWVYPSERERLYREFMANRGVASNFETRFRKKDGSEFWVRFSAKVFPEKGYMDGVGLDITQEKATTLALKDSEEKYRNIFENAQVALFRVRTEDGRLLEANPTMVDLFGYENRRVMLASFNIRKSLVDHDEAKRLNQELVSNRGMVDKFECQFVKKNGTPFWLRFSMRLYATEGYMQGVGTEITDEKRTLQQLTISERKFRVLAESTTAAIFILQGNRLIYANRTALQITGYPWEELSHLNPLDLFDTASGRRFQRVRLSHLRGEPSPDRLELKLITATNEERWIETTTASFELEGEKAWIFTGFDITERRRAENALKESENTYRTIFETTGTATIMIGEDDRITLANTEFAKMSGYEWDEIENRMPWHEFFEFETMPQMQEIHESASPLPPKNYETRLLSRDGSRHDGIMTLGTVPGTRQRVGSFLDLTETKRAEKQIFRAQKLAALGQIVAGVAHEINNPNNFIYFNLPILKRYIEAIQPILDRETERVPDLKILNMPYETFLEDVYKLLDNMEHGSKRITGIVSDLKNYIRSHDAEERLPRSIQEAVDHVVSLVGKQVQKMAKRFEVEVEENLPLVAMNAGKIEQVLINLVINAGQATRGDDSYVRLTAARKASQSGWVEISVEDNGIGMSEEIIANIFDPFFTTKSRDSGTGLGLAISQRIIEEHEGKITVNSEKGKGSRFTVVLPEAKEPNP